MPSCTTCRTPFSITPEDEAFYDQIAPVIGGAKLTMPSPTLCPDCRNQRRMAWRNDRSFHKRKCSKTGENIIALYPEGTPFPVYHSDEWWSDSWDGRDFGQEFDFSRPFFAQWEELMNKVPRRNMDLVNCENSLYCNYCGDDKNCYLDIAGESNEDCRYNLFTKYSTDCADCTFTYRSTLCYECIQCYDSYNCKYSMYMDNCNDCQFCFDCKGCNNCLLSINLRNKEYYILNKEHTKEEYEKKIAELKLDTFSGRKNVFAIWKNMRIENGIYRDMYVINGENCTGNNIQNSQNCSHAFNTSNSQDCAYLYDVLDAKDCRDLNYNLYNPEVAYEQISNLQMKSSAFNMASHYSSSVFYCDQCDNSHDLFGCIGLNHGEYCILNKQYTQEEYEALLPKIIEYMTQTKEWGEFFPASIAPFGYNETVAQEYMPLTKEEATKKGFLWREDEQRTTNPPTCQTPDAIEDVSETIADEVLQCESCRKNFKVIPQEVTFYKNGGIPLPRSCPDCRHRARIALRNPRTLFDRTCAKCSKAIRTSYASDRPETVYCEECYLEAVY